MAKTPSSDTHETMEPDALHDDYIHPLAKKFLWLGNEKVINSFIWIPIIGLAVTIPLALVYPFDPAHKAKWDFFGSWALIGFAAYSFVVLSAEPLFRLLARKENYYGEEVHPEVIVEPKVEVHHHD